MNDLMLNSTTMTMSSLDIAELVESRHDSVKRTIDRCVEKGAIGQPPLVDGPHAWASRGKSGYNLKWRYSEIDGMLATKTEAQR